MTAQAEPVSSTTGPDFTHSAASMRQRCDVEIAASSRAMPIM
jgi:hypothetical protein